MNILKNQNFVKYLAIFYIILICPPLFASTGVSDGRVSLPDGPGSVEGIGDNVNINPNMGAMSYSVKIAVPNGYAATTPNLSLNYSSSGGNSIAGMGWDIKMPAIERLTLRGLPRYSKEDEFAVNGSEQLVKVDDTEKYSEYRARFESGFVRYRWHKNSDGKHGYWTAEYPDGSKGFFGANSKGSILSDATTGTQEKGTFRYFLVEKTDVYGHTIKYRYKKYGSISLVDKIEYVFTKGPAKNVIQFTYEDRTDKISDCKVGYEELLTKRLKKVTVSISTTPIKEYIINYQDYDKSGGFSRILSVETIGAYNTPYPIIYKFGYSSSLGTLCDGVDCTKPFVSLMGSLEGANMQTGHATLIDINGDALPDVVDTGEDGKHRFFINSYNEGLNTFGSAIDSETSGTGYKLKESAVQVLILMVMVFLT